MEVGRLGLGTQFDADREAAAEGGPAIDDAFGWIESCYETSVALVRPNQLRAGGDLR